MTYALNYSQCKHSACSEPLISHLNRSTWRVALVHPRSPHTFLTISFSELPPQAMLSHTTLLIPGQLSRFKLHACSLHSSIPKIGTSSLSLVSIRVNAFQEIQTWCSLFGLGLFFGSCYLRQPSQCDTNYCQNLLAGQKS